MCAATRGMYTHTHTRVSAWLQSCMVLHYSHRRSLTTTHKNPAKARSEAASPFPAQETLHQDSSWVFFWSLINSSKGFSSELAGAQESHWFSRAGDRVKLQWHLVIINISQRCYQRENKTFIVRQLFKHRTHKIRSLTEAREWGGIQMRVDHVN